MGRDQGLVIPRKSGLTSLKPAPPRRRNGYPDLSPERKPRTSRRTGERQKASTWIRPVGLPVQNPGQKARPRIRGWIDAKLAFRGISPDLTTRIAL